MLILSLTLALSSLNNALSPPVLTTSSSANEQDAKKKEIENYKELTSAVLSMRTNVFDFVVTKTMLPIFNSLLTAAAAYIFAKEGSKVLGVYLGERNSNDKRSHK